MNNISHIISIVKASLIVFATFSCITTRAEVVYNYVPKIQFADSTKINKPRLYTLLSSTVVTGSALSYGLYNSWYKQYPRSSFHFFDDSKEWNQMDKYGHLYSAYNQADVYFQLLQWTGLSKNKSIIGGMIAGSTIQGVIEMFDGYSEQWGFSTWDTGFNILGVAAFGAQEYYWNKQKIRFKVFSFKRKYNEPPLVSNNGQSLAYTDRINQLYGSPYLSRFLKDYNAQSIWVSFNVASCFNTTKVPSWLNVALGFGSENLLGGFENEWLVDDEVFQAYDRKRYRQYFLSLDVDFAKIQTNQAWLKPILSGLNLLKMPAPTLEYNTQGEWHLHLILLR